MKTNLLICSSLRKTFLYVLLSLSLCFSCKKNEGTDVELDSLIAAKSWYLKQNKESYKRNTESFLMTKDKSVRVKKEIDWSGAKSYKLSDGTDITGIPVDLRFSDGKLANGNFLLLITNSEKGFKSIITKDQKTESSDTSLGSASTLENLYRKSNANLEKGGGINKIRAKLMNAPIVTCIDWYYVETTYDEEGNIIDVYIEFLYTECLETTGGGGGGTLEPTEQQDWGATTDEDYSENIVEEENNEVDTRYFIHYYKWTFHKAYQDLWVFRSYEKGRTKKIGTGNEKFWSFVHLNHFPVGVPLGKTINIQMIDAYTYFSPEAGTVNLYYKVQKVFNVEGTTSEYYSGEYTKSKTFGPQQYE
ncbi:hypothetical protein ACHMWN_00235 [Pedobacter sp. UC225_61]|uniref:hypothetical protein n=1 Tax=Pedobacter sp. UC225_61 TaxID=3374623 RepID=UPI0037ADB9D5